MPVKQIRRSRKRPAQFTDKDEDELCSLADHIWQSIAHDLGKIHVSDYVDCMHSQLNVRGDRTYIGCDARVYPVTDDLKVCRDMEMAKDPRLATISSWSVDPRPGDIAMDVLEAFYHFDNPGHHWAWRTVEQYMRRHADKRGMLQ